MKKNTCTATTDIENEELQKLVEALASYKAIAKEKNDYDELFSEARRDVDEFALTGDLRNTDKVSSMVVRQTQASLAEKRIVGVGDRLAIAERALDQEAEVVKRLIETALHQLKNGLAEKIASAMKEHVEDFQEARRMALKSKQVKAVTDRIFTLQYLANNLSGESVPIAEEYLKLAPAVFAEVEEAKKALGGAIPSEAEMMAP